MANAAAIRRKMAKAARKHGGEATLVRVIPGTLDEQTDNTTPPATLKYPCFAIWMPTSGDMLESGGSRRVRAEMCYISPDDFPAGVEPRADDGLVITSSGRERRIRSSKAMRLDGETVLYFEITVEP